MQEGERRRWKPVMAVRAEGASASVGYSPLLMIRIDRLVVFLQSLKPAVYRFLGFGSAIGGDAEVEECCEGLDREVEVGVVGHVAEAVDVLLSFEMVSFFRAKE